jgi:hypothetical protein
MYADGVVENPAVAAGTQRLAVASVDASAYSAQSERRFHAIVNALGAAAAAAADLGSSVHDEIDNVLGFGANAKCLCPGLAEGSVGAMSEGIAPWACRARQQIRLERRHTAKSGHGDSEMPAAKRSFGRFCKLSSTLGCKRPGKSP